MNKIKTILQWTDGYFISLSKGTYNDWILEKAGYFFKKNIKNSQKIIHKILKLKKMRNKLIFILKRYKQDKGKKFQ